MKTVTPAAARRARRRVMSICSSSCFPVSRVGLAAKARICPIASMRRANSDCVVPAQSPALMKDF
jgi:hypothetical protein